MPRGDEENYQNKVGFGDEEIKYYFKSENEGSQEIYHSFNYFKIKFQFKN